MISPNVKQYSVQLEKIGIKHSIVEHPHLVAVEDVLKYCKLTYEDGASTLVFKVDDGYISVIRRDDCKVDLKKLQQIIGSQLLRMATNEEFTQLTKLEPGAARIVIPEVKQTYIDERVLERKFVQAGSGSFTCSIQYQTNDLVKIPNSKVVSISELAIKERVNKSNRVFSGIRATGRLHLGNYLGAVKGMFELQEKYETVYMVVDTHTITTPFTPDLLRKNKREIIVDYLASGLDPEKSIITCQSMVPEHTELAFYFSSVMSIARMQHLPTFKDKIKQHPNHTTMALLNYPILMAADILIYKAGLVPVGIDQEPHLEIAREVARKMNEQYGMDFPEPVRFATKGEYIPSLKGEGKMSKSVEGSYINLTDSSDEIKKKIRSIPSATVAGGEMSEGVKTLFTFARLFLPDALQQYEEQFQSGTLKFVEIKDAVAEAISKDLKPLQEKRKELEAKPDYVDTVIKEGAEKARLIARNTVNEVKSKMGLG